MFANNIEEFCTGTAATITPTGITPGSILFSEKFVNLDTFSYVIEDADGTNLVGGEGTYNTGGTITRNDTWTWNGSVYDDSPGSNLTLSGGTHVIRAVPIASDMDNWNTAYTHSQAAHAPSDANNYSHPANHPPSIITEDSSNRFVTDAQISSWDGKQAALGFTPEDSANKGDANGYAELNSSGLVPSSQLPAYVDDVLSYANEAAFPGTGETGKIYIAEDTNLTFRWSGAAYTEISASLALGETSATAYRGDRGKTAYDHSQTAHNYAASSHGYHVPTPQGANNAVYLRNDNTWQTISPADIGAEPTLGFTPYNATNPNNYAPDQTSIVGITGTKTEFDTAVTDGNFMYIGDAPTTHSHGDADIDGLNASAVTTGTFGISRIPTGTTVSTVALGNDSRINNGQTAYDWILPQNEADLNLAYDAGPFRWSNTATNTPIASSYGTGLNIVSEAWAYNDTNNWLVQLAFPTSGNSMYFREVTNAEAFGGWKEVYHDGNFTDNSSNWDTAYSRVNTSKIGTSPGKTRYTGDLDTLTTVGFENIDVSATTNEPSGSTDGNLINMTWDSSTWGTQIYTQWDGSMFVRGKNSGSWSSWEEVLHTGNFVSGTDYAPAHSHPYDNYGSWTIMEGNGTESATISSGQTLHIEQGTGITVEYTATRQLTITNTAPNVVQTSVTGSSGSCTGNAATATLATDIKIFDNRAAGDVTPNNSAEKQVSFDFTDDIAGSAYTWDSVMTVKGWSDTYGVWQLMANAGNSGGDDLYFRHGFTTSWGTLRKVLDTGNFVSGTDYAPAHTHPYASDTHDHSGVYAGINGSLATDFSVDTLTADNGINVTAGDVKIGVGSATNSWLTIHGANDSSERTGISIGESDKWGAATMQMYYTGDGYFHLGMGTMTGSTHAAYRALTWQYTSKNTNFLGDCVPNADNTLNCGTAARTWGACHATNFYGNGSNITNVAAASCTGNAATVTNGVYTTGTQTVGGIKTFTSNPKISNSAPQLVFTETGALGGSWHMTVDGDDFSLRYPNTGTAPYAFMAVSDGSNVTSLQLMGGMSVNSSHNVTGINNLTVAGDITVGDDVFLGNGGWIYFDSTSADQLRMNHSTHTTASAAAFDFYNQTQSEYARIHAGRIQAEGHILLAAGQRFYLDGGSNTYIYEASSDELSFVVGGSTMMQLDQDAGEVQINNGHNLNILDGASGFLQQASTKMLKIPIPGGASFSNWATSNVGAIEISFPAAVYATDKMLTMWVDVYEYTTDRSFSMFIGGYIYQEEGSNEWVNETVVTHSNITSNDYAVRFGAEGSRHKIWIGELASDWSYPCITVRDVQVHGSSISAADWADDWDVTLESTAFGAVDATHSSNLPVASWASSAAAASTATTATLVTTTASANNGYLTFLDVATGGNQGIRTDVALLYTNATNSIACNISGTANSASQLYINNDDTGDTNCPILFTQNSTAGNKAVYEDSTLYFDNTNNYLHVPYVRASGNIHIDGTGPYLEIDSSDAGSANLYIRNTEGGIRQFTDSGNFYLAQTAVDSSAVEDYWMQCYKNGAVNLNYNGASKVTTTSTGISVTGGITATSNITAYSSDERLKESIPLQNCMDAVNQWEPIQYNWNELARGLDEAFNHDTIEVGLNAQSVNKTHPQLTSLAPFDRDDAGNSKSGEDYLTIDYGRTVAVLTGALQEKDLEIKNLRRRMERLEELMQGLL